MEFVNIADFLNVEFRCKRPHDGAVLVMLVVTACGAVIRPTVLIEVVKEAEERVEGGGSRVRDEGSWEERHLA